MNPVLLTILAIAALSVWLVREIRHAPHQPTVYPTHADALALKWAHIAEDFAPDEFELLRRIDRELAGAEAAVIRGWQDARAKRQNDPYNWQERGL